MERLANICNPPAWCVLICVKQPSTFGAKSFKFYGGNRKSANAYVCHGWRIISEQNEPEGILPAEKHLDKLFLLLAEEIPAAGRSWSAGFYSGAHRKRFFEPERVPTTHCFIFSQRDQLTITGRHTTGRHRVTASFSLKTCSVYLPPFIIFFTTSRRICARASTVYAS